MPAPPPRSALRDESGVHTAKAGAEVHTRTATAGAVPAHIGQVASTQTSSPPLKAPPQSAPPLRVAQAQPPPYKAAPLPKKAPPPPPRSDSEEGTIQGTMLTSEGKSIPTRKSPPSCVVPKKSLSAALQRAASSRPPIPPSAFEEVRDWTLPNSAERRWLEDPRSSGSFSTSVRGPNSRVTSPGSAARHIAKALCESHTRRTSQDQANDDLNRVVPQTRGQPKGRGRRKKVARRVAASPSSARRGSSGMESDHSSKDYVSATSSGSSRGVGMTKIIREFTAGLNSSRASRPMDTTAAASSADKNISNHRALTRHFDHLRHEQPTMGSPEQATNQETATAGVTSPPDSIELGTPLPGLSSRDQRPEVQDELDRLRGQATTTWLTAWPKLADGMAQVG